MKGISAMRHTTNRQTQPEEEVVPEYDMYTHYNIGGTEGPSPQGRLVLVVEKELSDASRRSLHKLLKHIMTYEDITMVSGLSRASMLQAEKMGNGLFYNRKDYLSPEQAFQLLPWREIWVVSHGLVWALRPANS
jgi:hypothetical protein